MNYQEYVENLFKNACYAACLSFHFRNMQELNWIQITQDILDGLKLNLLDSDCYVRFPIKFIELLCKTKYRDVVKVSINNLSDLPEGDWIVEYKKTPDAKASHFVVANKKGIVFDPSGNSVTVQVGKPFTYRKYII